VGCPWLSARRLPTRPRRPSLSGWPHHPPRSDRAYRARHGWPYARLHFVVVHGARR
jgi:hypothetical protein